MYQQRIGAIILAAGYSSRMGNFKPLLPLGGETAIARSVAGFRQAGITDIRVITGFRSRDLQPVLEKLGVQAVFNEQFNFGMFSSIHAGVSSLSDNIEGFLLLPVDTPLVKTNTIVKLIEKYKQCKCSVVYPTFLGKRGHPPLVSKRCFRTILDQEFSGNLRTVLQQFEQDACDVPCMDQAILLDMDTPEDYRKLISLQEARYLL